MSSGLEFGVRGAQVGAYLEAVDWLNTERAAQGMPELSVEMDPMRYPADRVEFPRQLAEFVRISISGDQLEGTSGLYQAITDRVLQTRQIEQGGFDKQWAGRMADLGDLQLD